jgi:hypothetical protein
LEVARITGRSRSRPGRDPVLDFAEAGDATLGEAEQIVQRGARERRPLGGRLHLDQAALAGHHHVGVDLGPRVLAVVEVAERPAVDHADADRGDRPGQRHRLDQFAIEQFLEGHPQGDEAAGDRGAARPAVGFEHVAVDVDAAFAERLEVDDDPQAAPDQPLDLHPAAVLLALRDVALLAIAGRGGQHRVLGGDPAFAAPHHPARHLLGDRGGADHPRPPHRDQGRAVGAFDEAGVDGDGPDVGRGAVVAA